MFYLQTNRGVITNMGKINTFIKSKLFGIILAGIHIALTVVLLIFILRIKMIPVKFLQFRILTKFPLR